MSKTIAAFDFDGTITTCDSLREFLFFSLGRRKALLKLTLLLPFLIAFLLKIIPRQKVKEKVLTTFFKGVSREKITHLGQAFATSSAMNKILREEVLQRLQFHKEQGHRCILISASIDPYLVPWGKLVGFDDVLCSTLEISPQDMVTGKLQGANCWGPEKVVRLKNLLGGEIDRYTIHAYGDSRGDKELLDMANYPTFFISNNLIGMIKSSLYNRTRMSWQKNVKTLR